MLRSVSLAAALVFATGTAAEAADAQSRFQAYGLGRLPCKRFVEICEAKKEECKLTGTWMEGYLSGFNALNKDTFDILPWQPPELVAEFTYNVCKQNPDAPVLEVVNELIRGLLVPQRVKSAAERVRIGEGDQAVGLYRDTIRALQERLIATGHLDGKADGAFGPSSKRAVEAFQKEMGLPATGVPDQRTLLAVFYGRPQQQGQAQQQPRRQQAAPSAPAAPAAAAGQPPAKLDLNLIPSPQ